MAIDLKYGRVTTEHGTIGEDEPVVVFRAQDKTLPYLLGIYLELCLTVGSPQRHIDAIERARRGVEEWQQSNPTQVPQSNSLRR